MKKILLIIVVNLTAIYSCFAQFDEKFYFPSREWHSIENVDFTEMTFQIENDTLHTVLFKSKAATKATIIYYHGTGGNISINASIAQLLTNEGFQVFMIDFRGYGKSTGKPTHLNIANDAQIIFDKMIVSDEFKNYPVIVFGASIGSQIATKIASNNEDKISALILDGAMSSFTYMALLSVPEEQKEMISTYVTSPYSAIEDIKNLRSIPKLFIHSKGDKSVPFSQGLAVYSNSPEPKSFWEYEGNHLESAYKFPTEYIQKINLLIDHSKKTKEMK
jgi:predicted alpha/beta-fold hydrolase